MREGKGGGDRCPGSLVGLRGFCVFGGGVGWGGGWGCWSIISASRGLLVFLWKGCTLNLSTHGKGEEGVCAVSPGELRLLDVCLMR